MPACGSRRRAGILLAGDLDLDNQVVIVIDEGDLSAWPARGRARWWTATQVDRGTVCS
jgi:hypothetical protein